MIQTTDEQLPKPKFRIGQVIMAPTRNGSLLPTKINQRWYEAHALADGDLEGGLTGPAGWYYHGYGWDGFHENEIRALNDDEK